MIMIMMYYINYIIIYGYSFWCNPMAMWLELAIWLVVQCAHLEKYERQWEGLLYPIYNGK